MPKFFIDKENISDNEIIVNGQDAVHIKNVLRYKIGDTIHITETGNEIKDFVCKIKGFDNGGVILEVVSVLENYVEPCVKVTLFQGLPKGGKLDLIIQKCVELGVYEIVPVLTERTVVKIDGTNDNKITRWNKIAEEAAKQCGRAFVPKILAPVLFSQAVAYSKNIDTNIIPYENEKSNGFRSLIMGNANTYGIFIGPEGGFTYKEIDLAMQNNIFSVSMGRRILRTETAAIAALTVLMYEKDW